ncbi:MAG: hypothetical protein KOO61_03465 [Spirochaetales bacterium]|nr:hypothetical protein [Spirochaetales bacterium]
MNTRKRRVVVFVVLAILIAAVPAAAQSAEGVTEDPALYAVGALGASNLYTSYFLLGTLADGYATAAYTAQFADELTRDVIGLNESSIDVLEQLLTEASLAGADKALVEDMITAHELLVDQAWGLLAYVEDSSNTEQWFRYRRQAWELISVLLDIK